jgi:hypothetical protein
MVNARGLQKNINDVHVEEGINVNLEDGYLSQTADSAALWVLMPRLARQDRITGPGLHLAIYFVHRVMSDLEREWCPSGCRSLPPIVKL